MRFWWCLLENSFHMNNEIPLVVMYMFKQQRDINIFTNFQLNYQNSKLSVIRKDWRQW